MENSYFKGPIRKIINSTTTTTTTTSSTSSTLSALEAEYYYKKEPKKFIENGSNEVANQSNAFLLPSWAFILFGLFILVAILSCGGFCMRRQNKNSKKTTRKLTTLKTFPSTKCLNEPTETSTITTFTSNASESRKSSCSRTMSSKSKRWGIVLLLVWPSFSIKK